MFRVSLAIEETKFIKRHHHRQPEARCKKVPPRHFYTYGFTETRGRSLYTTNAIELTMKAVRNRVRRSLANVNALSKTRICLPRDTTTSGPNVALRGFANPDTEDFLTKIFSGRQHCLRRAAASNRSQLEIRPHSCASEAILGLNGSEFPLSPSAPLITSRKARLRMRPGHVLT